MEVIQINAKFEEFDLYLSSNHFTDILIDVGLEIDRDYVIEELKDKPGTCKIKFNFNEQSKPNIKHRELEYTSMDDFITKLMANDVPHWIIAEAIVLCCSLELNGKPLNTDED